jgi:DNA modification methylase
MNYKIINGDILRFAAHYRGPKFHAVLCDPPYELGFMGRSWDSRGVSFRAETWAAIRSLLVPGAHLLAFGGTRTFHRIAVAIEDAGLEIRDTLGWLYGSGFPKSHDVSKAIDREAGAEREVIEKKFRGNRAGVSSGIKGNVVPRTDTITAPATDAARAWQGYGTALKPAWEPVIVARNPLAGTVAQNAIEHGAGALSIDACRVERDASDASGWSKSGSKASENRAMSGANYARDPKSDAAARWPANIIHDGSDEIAEVMGNAQRFFYCAKASKRERDEGLGQMSLNKAGALNMRTDTHAERNGQTTAPRANHHPTVKPIALTEYLAKLILPPASIGERRIFVPFAGSGSECIGAALAGWDTIVGVEREAEYVKIAQARLKHFANKS